MWTLAFWLTNNGVCMHFVVFNFAQDTGHLLVKLWTELCVQTWKFTFFVSPLFHSLNTLSLIVWFRLSRVFFIPNCGGSKFTFFMRKQHKTKQYQEYTKRLQHQLALSNLWQYLLFSFVCFQRSTHALICFILDVFVCPRFLNAW